MSGRDGTDGPDETGPGAAGEDATATAEGDREPGGPDPAGAAGRAGDGPDTSAMPGVTVVLPGQLRDLAGGGPVVRLDGRPATVREALDALRELHPAVHRRLVTEQGELRPHLNVFVGGTDARHAGGLDAPLEAGAELVVLPSVSGG